MVQTFWTSFNIIEYTTNAEIIDKKPYQTFLELNLKTEDHQYLTKLWNISSQNARVGEVLLIYVYKRPRY